MRSWSRSPRTVRCRGAPTPPAEIPGTPDSGRDPILAGVSVNLPLWKKKYRASEREAREMRAAALLGALRSGPGSIPAREILTMATRGGAESLYPEYMKKIEEMRRQAAADSPSSR